MRTLYLLIAFCVAGVMHIAWSRGSQAAELETRLISGHTTIYPFEPLPLLVEILNNEDEDQLVTGLDTSVTIFIRKADNQHWVPVSGEETYVYTSPFVDTPPKIKARSVWRSLHIISVDPLGQHIFAKSGKYFLKAQTPSKTSKDLPLTVQDLPRQDLVAAKDLEEQGLYRYFVSEKLRRENLRTEGKAANSAIDQRLTLFAEKHPRSRYASWAQLARIFVRELPAVTPFWVGAVKRDHAKLVALQKELLGFPDLHPSVSVVAQFEAGVLGTIAGDKVDAEKAFSSARRPHIDATMPVRIELFKQIIDESPWMVHQMPVANPKDILSDTISKLEKEGYEVKAFAKKFPDKFKEYSAQESLLYKTFRDGKISEADYYVSLSNLLQRYITETIKPK